MVLGVPIFMLFRVFLVRNTYISDLTAIFFEQAVKNKKR